MFRINIKLWYQDGTGRDEDLQRVVAYVPDRILYNGYWWEKEKSCIDLDEDIYTKIHYAQLSS